MANKKKSKGKNLKTIIAISAVVLASASLFLGFYYNSRSELCKAQKMAEKKRLDSINQSQEYYRSAKNIEEENRRLAEQGNNSLPVNFHNSSDTSLAICIHYKTLNNTWVTAGHFQVRPGEVMDFSQRTNHPEIFLSVTYPNGKTLADKRIIVNANDLSTQDYELKPVKEQGAFMLISDLNAPYPTSSTKFYKVKADEKSRIFIELDDRRLGADLAAFASKYHLVSQHSKRDSVLRTAKRLLRRLRD